MDDRDNGELTKSRSESHSVLIKEDDDNNDEHETIVGGEFLRSRCTTDTIINDGNKSGGRFRGLERRSSIENFGQFGFLVPALALFPHADGADALTRQFGELQGQHRELKLAAAHIEDALNGRGSYGKARSYFKPPLARSCFKILNNPWFRKAMMINTLLHSFTIFFEPPTVSLHEVSPLIFILELFCIVLYIFDLVVNITFLTWPVFWSRKAEPRAWNGIQFIFVSMFIVDYILFAVSVLTRTYIPQVFRCFRLAVILNKAKNIRHILMVLLTIGFKLSKVFAIIFVFIWVSSCISLYLLMDVYECRPRRDNLTIQTSTYEGKEIPCPVTSKEDVYNGTFGHVGYGMLRLFVLLSTENYPEVMLPSLRVRPWYFFFFGSYVFFGVFFLTSIVLAIVVDSYWLFSKKHVKKERARERAELAKAWNLLDPLGHGTLSVQDEKFVELFRLLKPKNLDEENMELIEMLDTNEDGEVDSFEWTTMLSQVLGYEFEEEDELTDEDFPCNFQCFYRIRELAVEMTETILFTRLILVLIIIHCIIFSLKREGHSYTEELSLQVIRTIIVTIFMFEGLMRVIVLGKKIMSLLELMDVALILVAFCANLAWYTPLGSHSYLRDYTTLVSCLAVFCRLPFNNSQLKRAIEVFIRIAPVMVDLICLLFIILYLFAAVGMELFRKSPVVDREGHMYLETCGIGFNTFPCSCLILFQMVTTSNWHEIMNSVIASTGLYWTSLYFVVAYILLNMVVMNLFVAIAIEAFNKLATHEEEQHPGVGRHLSDQRPSTAVKTTTIKSQAVEVFHSFASSIFGSARAEQVVERRQSLAPSLGGRDASFKRGSLAVPKIGATLSEENETPEGDKDSKGDKRERKLKKRMKEKKTKRDLNEAENKVRVVTTYKGSRTTDLDLTVGDEITIIQKKENWWQGHCKNRVGWFPASHVVMGTVKAIPEYHKRSKKCAQQRESKAEVLEKTQITELTREKTVPPPVVPEVSFLKERASTLSNQLPGTPPVRGRLKVKKTGDWRKEILGEMTVMNAEEMRELNNIMRAELRTPVGRPRPKPKQSSLDWDSGVIRDSMFQEEPDHIDIDRGLRPASARSAEPRSFISRYPPSNPIHGRNTVRPFSGEFPQTRPAELPEVNPKPKVPELFIAPGSPTLSRKEKKKNSEDLVQRLDVKNKSSSKAKGKANKVNKMKNGEMPDWMVKFVNDNKLTVGDDVKFEETKQQRGRRGSSTTGLSTRNGTSSSKSSTGSALKSDTSALKSRSTGNIPGDVETQFRKKNPQVLKFVKRV